MDSVDIYLLGNRVNERCQCDVPLGEALAIMSRESNRDSVVNIEPLGVVVHLVGLDGNTGHEPRVEQDRKIRYELEQGLIWETKQYCSL